MSLEKLAIVGFIFIAFGVVLIVLSSLSSSEIKTGGVVLVGPIPLVFGSDRRLIYVSCVFAAFVLIVWFLARKFK